MIIVVSDNSLISGLIAIDRIHILPALYSEIIIPQGVVEELLRMTDKQAEVEEVLNAEWVKIQPIVDRTLYNHLINNLDKGESEAIALAKELNADLVLIDEVKGRKLARSLGLNVTGLLGILIEAKVNGLIMAVKPILEELRVEAGFWMSEALYKKVLKSVGEL